MYLKKMIWSKNEEYLKYYNQRIKMKVSIMPSRLGSPNRNKKFLLNRLQDMYGQDFHPIMKMAENAIRLHEIASRNDTIDGLNALSMLGLRLLNIQNLSLRRWNIVTTKVF